jgi:hypothetical protein
VPIDGLGGFITFQTATVGHIDGEGHCDALEAVSAGAHPTLLPVSEDRRDAAVQRKRGSLSGIG